MHDPDRPWDAFPLELWERLLARVYIDVPFDPDDIALDAGLDEAQIAALRAWCVEVEFEDAARQAAGIMLETDRRFAEHCKGDGDLSPEELNAKIKADLEAIRVKAARR